MRAAREELRPGRGLGFRESDPVWPGRGLREVPPTDRGRSGGLPGRGGGRGLLPGASQRCILGGAATRVTVERLTEGLCGAHRPGHFDGVTTVVAKLFNIVQPDVAYFGQKDAQQAAVIRRMVKDLLWPMEIVVCPTVREPDGLAMSSRNAYLRPADRRQALSLSAALFWARDQILAGRRDVAELSAEMRRRIEAAGPCSDRLRRNRRCRRVDRPGQARGRCLLALAVRIGGTRLIDNVVVDAG